MTLLNTPHSQLWLLQLTWLPLSDKLAAWDKWKREFELDLVDFSTYRLLPGCYKALMELGHQDILLPKLKGIYKKCFANNSRLFHAVAPLITALSQNGVEPCFLKGGALILRGFEETGTRCMTDIDVLIPISAVQKSLSFCKSLGWHFQKKVVSVEAELKYGHSFELFNSNEVNLDLHWKPINIHQSHFFNELIWKDIENAQFLTMDVFVPSASFQFFQVIAHAVHDSWKDLYWVSDLCAIGRATNWLLDWNKIREWSEVAHVSAFLGEVLRLLVEELAAPIPERVIKEVAGSRKSLHENFNEYASKKTSFEFWGGLIIKINEYLRRNPDCHSPVLLVLSFFGYLKYCWQLEHWWQFPIEAIRVGMRVMCRNLAKTFSMLTKKISSFSTTPYA